MWCSGKGKVRGEGGVQAEPLLPLYGSQQRPGGCSVPWSIARTCAGRPGFPAPPASSGPLCRCMLSCRAVLCSRPARACRHTALHTSTHTCLYRLYRR